MHICTTLLSFVTEIQITVLPHIFLFFQITFQENICLCRHLSLNLQYGGDCSNNDVMLILCSLSVFIRSFCSCHDIVSQMELLSSFLDRLTFKKNQFQEDIL